jgi:hypothetical protein
MNLLLDMPIHTFHQKMTSKKSSAGNRCNLAAFSILDLLEMIGDGNCQYSRKPFLDFNDATFERINPNKGYVKGNVLMVCQMANSHKANLDAFVKHKIIANDVKIKLLRKAIYQLEKEGKSIS